MTPRGIIRNILNGNWSLFLDALYRKIFGLKDHSGVKVVEEDWDYLLVLDACRYDVFKEVNWKEGDLDKKTSRGSTTIEWLNRNFTDRYEDIIYVGANPQIHPADLEGYQGHHGEHFGADEHFHDVEHLYLEDEEQEGGTTPPEYVTERALEKVDEHPDKRLIAHYMQPHSPYIGEGSEGGKTMADLRNGGRSWDEVREYYRANLVRVLESVEEFLDSVEGTVVITSDHGELFGEYGISRHPHGVYFSELVEVPWLELENKDA